MAVTNIRKTSSTVLLVLIAVAVIVFVLFSIGGNVDDAAALLEPKYTDLLLYTCYAFFGISLLVLLLFALTGFVRVFATNKKAALTGMGGVIALAAIMIITYSIGSTERLPLGTDAQVYNVDSVLKSSDMWIYSIYTVLCLTIVTMIWGAIRSIISKK